MPAQAFSNGVNSNNFSSHGWSEIFINVVDHAGDGRYKDGDAITVKNRPQIRCANAQMLSRWWNEGFTAGGLRPDGLARAVQNKTYEFRFERVGPELVQKYRTADEVLLGTFGPPGSVGPGPEPHNEKGYHIYVSEYVQKRKTHARHRVFGTNGSEIWFGGAENWRDKSNLDFVWNEIETRTVNREENYPDWPATSLEKKHYLCLRTSNVTLSEMRPLMESVTDTLAQESVLITAVNESNPGFFDITVADPIVLSTFNRLSDGINPNLYDVVNFVDSQNFVVRRNSPDPPQAGDGGAFVSYVNVIHKRKNQLLWRDFRGMSSHIADVLNTNVEVDVRAVVPKVVSQLELVSRI